MFRCHIILYISLVCSCFFANAQQIQIMYLGHSAFTIEFDHITVVTDYGKPNAWKQWGWDSPISDIGDLVPDIMTYSHLHEDHYDSMRIHHGVKHILREGESLVFNQLKIDAIPSCEDKFGDFNNTSYLFSYKGINILHAGDIQTMIANIENDSVAEYIENNFPKNIDVLIMPIEGKMKYLDKTYQFIEFLQPKNVIPSHYWSQAYLDEFISLMDTCYSRFFPYKVYDVNDSSFNLDENNFRIIILKRLSKKE